MTVAFILLLALQAVTLLYIWIIINSLVDVNNNLGRIERKVEKLDRRVIKMEVLNVAKEVNMSRLEVERAIRGEKK
jgi:hypothetical protein